MRFSILTISVLLFAATSFGQSMRGTSMRGYIPFTPPVVIVNGGCNPPTRVVRIAPAPRHATAAERLAMTGVAFGSNAAYVGYVEPITIDNPFVVSLGDKSFKILPEAINNGVRDSIRRRADKESISE